MAAVLMLPPGEAEAATEAAAFFTLQAVVPMVMVGAAAMAVAVWAIHLQRRLAAVTDDLACANVALQTADARLATIIDHAPVSVYMRDRQGRYLLMNRECRRRYGLAPDATLPLPIDTLFETEEAAERLARDREVFEMGRVTTAEREYTYPSGLRRNMVTLRFPVTDPHGAVVAVGLISSDETDQRQAEREALAAHSRLLEAIEAMGDGFAYYDAKGCLVMCNSRYRFPGLDRAFLPGTPFEDVVRVGIAAGRYADVGDDIEAFVRGRVACLGKPSAQSELAFSDGRWAMASMRRTADGGTVIMLIDITPRKKMEMALRDSESRYRDLYNHAPVMLHSIDAEGRLAIVSDFWLEVMGYWRADVIGRPLGDFLDPASRLRLERDLLPRLKATGSLKDVELRVVKHGGTLVDVELSAVAEREADGRFVNFLAVLFDVSDRKRAEAAVLAARRRLYDSIEAIADGFGLFDVEERLILSNSKYPPQAIRDIGVPGVTFETLVRTGMARGMYGDFRDGGEALVAEHLAHFRRGSGTREVTLRGGMSVLISFRKTDIDDTVVTLTDVTERKAIEEELRQAQKMEAVGQLTGGIAHDFNNLLGIVLGNLELAEAGQGNRDRVQTRLSRAIAAVKRGADLTRRLLAFSRRQALDPEATQVDGLVQGMTDMLSRALGEQVRVELDLQAGGAAALVDRAQLETALLNLSLNARDAMPRGGTLTLRTRTSLAEGTSADAVFIDVVDSGEGMPPEVAARAVEPFFTTKDVGQGSGLGLSMVYGFVEQSGGSLDIVSVVGRGTTVTIRLPLVSAAADRPAAAPVEPQMPRGSGESVLLVEDDAQLRSLAREMLLSLGYAVTDAADGPEALTILQRGAPVDLLFTDVVLPQGLSGGEVARLARAQRPGLRVLYCSGYAQDAVRASGIWPPDAKLLDKPYRRRDLARLLRVVFDAPAEPALADGPRMASPLPDSVAGDRNEPAS